MKQKINENEVIYHTNDTHKGGSLIDDSLGARNDFCMGISEYFAEEFGKMGRHSVQEGFYVIEGNGYAKVADDEFSIKKGDSFLVPAGAEHVLRKNKNSQTLKVLWAHGAS